MRKSLFSAAVISVASSVLAIPPSARGQWAQDGVLLCNTEGPSDVTASVPDGQGGAFVVFVDTEPMEVPKVQRIDADGFIAAGWDTCGVRCTSLSGIITFWYPVAVADGAGGLYVAWWMEESPSGRRRCRVQRVTPLGTIASGWPTDGRRISSAGNETDPRLAPDGNGGVFAAWSYPVNAPYLQHFLSDGSYAAGWDSLGKTVTTTPGRNASVVSDGQGGAIVAWMDFRPGTTGADIYAQRIIGDGVLQWQTNGVPLCTAPGNQGDFGCLRGGVGPLAIADGSGGAVVIWTDGRACDSRGMDVFAQRVAADGTIPPGWDPNGNPIATAPGDQPAYPYQYQGLSIVSDDLGGAICTWTDDRDPTDVDLYVQRIESSGGIAPGWPVDGLLLCGVTGLQFFLALTTDGQSGAIVSWTDYRNEPSMNEIYASHVTSGGTIANDGPEDGVVVCSAESNSNGAIVSNDQGGAILSWDSVRLGRWQPYAQRVTSGASPLSVGPSASGPDALDALIIYPRPASQSVIVEFRNVQQHVESSLSLQVFDATGRRIRTLLSAGRALPANRLLTWDGSDDSGKRVSSGVYFFRLEAPGVTECERVVLIR